jgi:hypothetical protein
MPQQPVLGQLNLVVQDMDTTLGFYPASASTSKPTQAPSTPPPSYGMLIEWDHADFFSQWNTSWNGTIAGSAVLGFWVATRRSVDDLYSDLTRAGHKGHHPRLFVAERGVTARR